MTPAAPSTASDRQSRNVDGGRPISRSRVIPPASPTTAASTSTPNGSSRARTPASPPVMPNTNVPHRLGTRIAVGADPGKSVYTVEDGTDIDPSQVHSARPDPSRRRAGGRDPVGARM